MNTYTLYFNGESLYCYSRNDYVSYWQNSAAVAITCSRAYDSNMCYGEHNIIYQSHLPITLETHPEYFL